MSPYKTLAPTYMIRPITLPEKSPYTERNNCFCRRDLPFTNRILSCLPNILQTTFLRSIAL